MLGVIGAHHPADLPTVTRSYTFRFPAESQLVAAIRTACDLPEPEPEPDDAASESDPAQTPGSGGGNSLG